jgi:hypothetical protein
MATMSESKTPLDRALDVFVFAPIGLMLNADEVIRQMAERGRQSVSAARFLGQMAVHQGRTELDKAMGKLGEQTSALVDQISEVAGSRPRAHVAPVTPAPPTEGQAAPTEAAVASSPSTAASPATATSPDGVGPSVASLAIPDYDSLAASQVLPRLAGLSAAELEAVRRYEVAHRGRKTILNRIAQLQA